MQSHTERRHILCRYNLNIFTAMKPNNLPFTEYRKYLLLPLLSSGCRTVQSCYTVLCLTVWDYPYATAGLMMKTGRTYSLQQMMLWSRCAAERKKRQNCLRSLTQKKASVLLNAKSKGKENRQSYI